jgi:hypothetical protein
MLLGQRRYKLSKETVMTIRVGSFAEDYTASRELLQ